MRPAAPWQRGLTPLPDSPCAYGPCDKAVVSKGLCQAHYRQQSKGQELRPLIRRRVAKPRGMGQIRDALGRKECHSCGRWLAETDFKANATGCDGLSHDCRQCHRARRYGMTATELQQLLEAQGNECAVRNCGSLEGRPWVVDHDHGCCPTRSASCGDCVRGILCYSCNVALGLAREKVGILQGLQEYLSVATT